MLKFAWIENKMYNETAINGMDRLYWIENTLATFPACVLEHASCCWCLPVQVIDVVSHISYIDLAVMNEGIETLWVVLT